MCAIGELLNYPKNRALEFFTHGYILLRLCDFTHALVPPIRDMWPSALVHSCPYQKWLILKYICVEDIWFIGCIVFTNKILQLKFNAWWPDLLKRWWDSFTNGEIKCWYNILTSASLNVMLSLSTNSPGTKSGRLGGIHNNVLFFFFSSCLSHWFVMSKWSVRKTEEERRGGGNMKWRENRSIGENEKKKERHHLVN